MTLRLPRRQSATTVARRPSVWPLASTMYHFFSMVEGLATKVFMRSLVSVTERAPTWTREREL